MNKNPSLTAKISVNLISMGEGVLLSLVFGMAGALLAGIFWLILDLLSRCHTYWLYGTPFLAAAITLTALRFNKDIRGNGTDRYIHYYTTPSENIPWHTFILKPVITAAGLALGLSGGASGPMLSSGGAAAKFLSQKLPFSAFEGGDTNGRHCEVIAGAAALAAFSGLPLTAAVYAAEVLNPDKIEYKALLYALFGSYFAHMTARSYMPSLIKTHYVITEGLQIMPALLSVVFGIAAGILYLAGNSAAAYLYKKVRSHWILPCAGALICLLCGLCVSKETLGLNTTYLDSIITGKLALTTLVLFIIGKTLAVHGTVGLGNSGGHFFPTLLIAAAAGKCAAILWGMNHTDLVMPFIATSIAAAFSCIHNTPLAAIIVCVEIFGAGAIPYCMLGSVSGFFLVRSAVLYQYRLQLASQE